MLLWVMLLGMMTLINVTMVGAVMQVFASVPDVAFLTIISRPRTRKTDPEEVPLSPWDASQRLGKILRRIIGSCIAIAASAIAISIWALAAGWGAVAIIAITLWVVAGNLLFTSIAPANWRRRASRIRPDIYDEEPEKSHPERPGLG